VDGSGWSCGCCSLNEAGVRAREVANSTQEADFGAIVGGVQSSRALIGPCPRRREDNGGNTSSVVHSQSRAKRSHRPQRGWCSSHLTFLPRQVRHPESRRVNRCRYDFGLDRTGGHQAREGPGRGNCYPVSSASQARFDGVCWGGLCPCSSSLQTIGQKGGTMEGGRRKPENIEMFKVSNQER
jgi:hypothetical protein